MIFDEDELFKLLDEADNMSEGEVLPQGIQDELKEKQRLCYHEWKRQNGFRFDYMLCSRCGLKRDFKEGEE